MTEALPVISAHHGEQVYATWANGRCSHCNSITPEAFAGQVDAGTAQAGWHWAGETPLYVETQAGRFYAEHLADVGDGWLRWWQAEIALATGVVFYREGDEGWLLWHTFIDDRILRSGETMLPATVDRIMAFLDEIDRGQS